MSLKFWKGWDHCRIKRHVMWTRSGYDLCAKHGGR